MTRAAHNRPEKLSDPVPSVADNIEQTDGGEIVLIDCDTCRVRDQACGDCVISVLLGNADGSVDFDDIEHQAVDVLAAQGLVPPLRLVSERPITDRDIA